jgi:pyruvate formate lyase activating enzyme
MKEARFYEKKEDNAVQCRLCPHHCLLKLGQTGICHVRKNEKGSLHALSYGHLVAKNPDPIEKKPLFHFHPGSRSYSIATVGCNLQCKHCQNADISQATPNEIFTEYTSPEDVVQAAKKTGCKSIAYTYTEPTIFYEYAYDTAKLAHDQGLKNVFVTNGFIEKEPLEEIAPYLDAANIDLKSMSETFYKKICGGHLQPVLDRIQDYHDLGIWIELTTLLIPGYNDSKKELNDIARFIADIDAEIPWHITGFHPTYKLTDAKATTISALEQAAKIGKDQGLQYVYQGNLGSGEDTVCPSCGKTLISRRVFYVAKNVIKDSACPYCGKKIKGIGMDGS